MHVSTATAYVFPSSVLAAARFGRYGVPVFFVISGLVVPFSLLGRGYTIRGFPRYVLRRVLRLDPPYLAALGLALLLAAARRSFTYSASDIALHVGYLTGLAGRSWVVSAFWTLGIEFQYYLLMGLLLAWVLPRARYLTTPSARGPILLGLLLAWFFLLSEAEWALHRVLTDAQLTGVWLLYKDYFLLGMAALVVREYRMSVFALIAFGFVVFGWEGRLEWESTTLLLGIAALFAGAPATWRWLRSPVGRLAAWLGTISYSLYVTHELVVGLLTVRLRGRGWMPEAIAGIWLVVAIEVLLCLGLAAVFYRLFERPALRWSRRVTVTPFS